LNAQALRNLSRIGQRALNLARPTLSFASAIPSSRPVWSGIKPSNAVSTLDNAMLRLAQTAMDHAGDGW
jgi:hypothetical protein